MSGSTFDASQYVDSIQVSHLHMSHDTVRLAQLNRNADELLAQKETTTLYFTRDVSFDEVCRRTMTQGFFCLARRLASEERSVHIRT